MDIEVFCGLIGLSFIAFLYVLVFSLNQKVSFSLPRRSKQDGLRNWFMVSHWKKKKNFARYKSTKNSI